MGYVINIFLQIVLLVGILKPIKLFWDVIEVNRPSFLLFFIQLFILYVVMQFIRVYGYIEIIMQ